MAGFGRHVAPWWVERVVLYSPLEPRRCAELLDNRLRAGRRLPITSRTGGEHARSLVGNVLGDRFSVRTTMWKQSFWTRPNNLLTEVAGRLVGEPAGGTRIECTVRLHRFAAIMTGIIAAFWIVSMLQIPFYLALVDMSDDTRLFLLLVPLFFLVGTAAYVSGRWYALEERDALLMLLRGLLAAS